MRKQTRGVSCSKLNCQNVSGSSSCRHSGPNPNLNDETDHLARWPMSGHGNAGGCLPTQVPAEVQKSIPTSDGRTYQSERERRPLRGQQG